VLAENSVNVRYHETLAMTLRRPLIRAAKDSKASLREYKEKKEKQKRGQRRLAPILGAVALIILIVVALAYYDSRGTVPSSTVVYCGVFQYLLTTVRSVVGAATSNVTVTMSTAVSFTTSTSLGPIGKTYSNMTSTTNAAKVVGGVETICKYISDTSSSSSKLGG
jgi:hypothetical protein